MNEHAITWADLSASLGVAEEDLRGIVAGRSDLEADAGPTTAGVRLIVSVLNADDEPDDAPAPPPAPAPRPARRPAPRPAPRPYRRTRAPFRLSGWHVVAITALILWAVFGLVSKAMSIEAESDELPSGIVYTTSCAEDDTPSRIEVPCVYDASRRDGGGLSYVMAPAD